jgi:hypothetical protein
LVLEGWTRDWIRGLLVESPLLFARAEIEDEWFQGWTVDARLMIDDSCHFYCSCNLVVEALILLVRDMESVLGTFN